MTGLFGAPATVDFVIPLPEMGCGPGRTTLRVGIDAGQGAEAFAAAIEEQGGALDRIAFSTRGAAANREAFERRFGRGAPPAA